MDKRLTGIFGTLIMLGFGTFSFYRFYNTGIIFFLLMMFRDFLASWFLINRKVSTGNSSSKKIALVSYVSSAIPLFYFKGIASSPILVTISSIISIIGFLISTLALIELGKSFGVSPANRGLVTSGLYKFTNHPMYIGYVISEFSLLLINPLNLIIFLISGGFYFYRARNENLVLLS